MEESKLGVVAVKSIGFFLIGLGAFIVFSKISVGVKK